MRNEIAGKDERKEAIVMITIGLLTNSVLSANYGVNALSIANMVLIERCCKRNNIQHQYFIFGDQSKADNQIKKIQMIDDLRDTVINIVPDLEFRRLKSVSSFIKNIKKCDVIFDTSGGDSYSDIYGNTRMLHQYVPKCISLALKKRLILTPQTIGPFKSATWKKLCERQLQDCMAVFARDYASYTLGKNEFNLENIFQVTDMAMILPYTHTVLDGSTSSRLRVGLNISGLLYNGGYTENNQFGLKSDYKELIGRLIKMLTEELYCDVYLVPHVITTGIESDNEACDSLKAKYPLVKYNRVFEGPIEAKSFISGLDLFIGSRMHSTIAAISSGVPVIPLSYSRKFEGLFGSIEYKDCINLKELDEESVLEIIRNGVNEIKRLQSCVQKSNEIIREKMEAYNRLLDELLRKCDK